MRRGVRVGHGLSSGSCNAVPSSSPRERAHPSLLPDIGHSASPGDGTFAHRPSFRPWTRASGCGCTLTARPEHSEGTRRQNLWVSLPEASWVHARHVRSRIRSATARTSSNCAGSGTCGLAVLRIVAERLDAPVWPAGTSPSDADSCRDSSTSRQQRLTVGGGKRAPQERPLRLMAAGLPHKR